MSVRLQVLLFLCVNDLLCAILAHCVHFTCDILCWLIWCILASDSSKAPSISSQLVDEASRWLRWLESSALSSLHYLDTVDWVREVHEACKNLCREVFLWNSWRKQIDRALNRYVCVVWTGGVYIWCWSQCVPLPSWRKRGDGARYSSSLFSVDKRR